MSTSNLAAASLIFSIFASDIPFISHILFRVVIWMPYKICEMKRDVVAKGLGRLFLNLY